MKVLFWGVSPAVQTGYGRATRELVPRLKARGIDITVYSMSGQDGDSSIGDNVMVYGNRHRGDFGILGELCRSLEPDLVLSWFDLWNADGLIPPDLPPHVAYGVVDNFPLTPTMRRVADQAFAVVPATRHAQKMLSQGGIRPKQVIYHGVDTEVFTPGDRDEARARLGFPKEAYIVLTVATNRDFRKNLSGMMAAFSAWSRGNGFSNPPFNPLWVLWTDPAGHRGMGEYDLQDLWASQETPGKLWMPDSLTYSMGLPDSGMADLYRAANVHLSCSYGEGFCFPVIEAGACGLATIGSDNSVYPELIDGRTGPRGMLVATEAYIAQPKVNGWQSIPGHRHMVEKLQWSYEHQDSVEKMGKRAREFALECDWEKVADQWVEMLEGIHDDVGRQRAHHELQNQEPGGGSGEALPSEMA